MEIFDPLRRKNVKLTPEEGVRQATIQLLNTRCGVPLTMMAAERGFVFNGLQYRADILVYDRNVQPLMLVECKAPEVTLDSKVIDQVIRYNKVLKVKFILVTNGKSSYLCRWNPSGECYEFASEMPSYEQMLQL